MAKKRILIVDDELDYRILLRDRFEKMGYEVEEAFRADEAYDRLCRQSFDLLMVDFSMQDMRGDELCQKLRLEAKFKSLPIIIITGYSSFDEEWFIQKGASEVVYKPLELEKVLELVKRYTGV